MPRRCQRSLFGREEPIAEPVYQPAFQPVVQPAIQTVVQPAIQPVVQPAIQPVVQSAIQPVVQSAIQPVVQSAIQPVVQPEASAFPPIYQTEPAFPCVILEGLLPLLDEKNQHTFYQALDTRSRSIYHYAHEKTMYEKGGCRLTQFLTQQDLEEFDYEKYLYVRGENMRNITDVSIRACINFKRNGMKLLENYIKALYIPEGNFVDRFIVTITSDDMNVELNSVTVGPELFLRIHEYYEDCCTIELHYEKQNNNPIEVFDVEFFNNVETPIDPEGDTSMFILSFGGVFNLGPLDAFIKSNGLGGDAEGRRIFGTKKFIAIQNFTNKAE